MAPLLSMLFIMEPLSLPNQREPCKAINMHSKWPTEHKIPKLSKCIGTPMLTNCSIILKSAMAHPC